MCEIWPDTGRIIWILKDRREFCRVELSIPELEQRYFEISATKDFEYEYKVLLGVIKNALRKGFERVDSSYAQRIAVRDSDDATTEEKMTRPQMMLIHGKRIGTGDQNLASGTRNATP